jgi:RimJ/RimL family protein N-acetyltransferase
MSQYPNEFEKNISLLDGTHIFLRPELSTDTEMLWQMFSTLSRDSLRYLVLPFSRERIERWTGNIDYDKALPILAVVKEPNKTRVVASASLVFNEAAPIMHKAEFGITVHDDFQNKGLGTVMTKYMIEVARRKKLNKVSLTVVAENRRAIHVYEMCGFKIEAKLEKENLVDGKFYDDYIMSIFL